LETKVKEQNEKLLETKLIHETCLAEIDEKDRIISEKTVIIKLSTSLSKVI
jgi:hypothetical protein